MNAQPVPKKVDYRPEGPALFESMMAGKLAEAVHLAGIASAHHSVIINTNYLRLDTAHSEAIPFTRIDVGPRHGT